MKGLTITFAVIVGVILVAVGISFYIYTNLMNSANVAHSQGINAGYSQGYAQGTKEGSAAGYQAGSKQGYLAAISAENTTGNTTGNASVDNGTFFIYNPTYKQMMILLDQSGQNTAQGVLDYADANGVRAAYVRVPIARPAPEGRVYLYQLVAFDTVDRGLVIIEPWSRREVKVEVGKSYSKLNGFPPVNYDDTITKVTFVW